MLVSLLRFHCIPHQNKISIKRTMPSLHLAVCQIKTLLFVSFFAHSVAWSYKVSCGTSMTNAGHRRYTAQGGGSTVLKRGGTVLACGSNLNPGEQLSLSSSGTSGTVHFFSTEPTSLNLKKWTWQVIYCIRSQAEPQLSAAVVVQLDPPHQQLQ